jgi:hypothetical protein
MHSRHPSRCRRARSTLFALISALLLAAVHASQCAGGGGTCDAPEQQLQCASDPSLVLQVTCDICPHVRLPITTVCQYFSLDDAGRILLPPGINDVVLDVGQVRASPPPHWHTGLTLARQADTPILPSSDSNMVCSMMRQHCSRVAAAALRCCCRCRCCCFCC